MKAAMQAVLALAATKAKGRKFEEKPFRHSALIDEDWRDQPIPPDDYEPPSQLARRQDDEQEAA